MEACSNNGPYSLNHRAHEDHKERPSDFVPAPNERAGKRQCLTNGFLLTRRHRATENGVGLPAPGTGRGAGGHPRTDNPLPCGELPSFARPSRASATGSPSQTLQPCCMARHPRTNGQSPVGAQAIQQKTESGVRLVLPGLQNLELRKIVGRASEPRNGVGTGVETQPDSFVVGRRSPLLGWAEETLGQRKADHCRRRPSPCSLCSLW